MYNQASFQVDNDLTVFQGYTNGATWNGWQCPCFTKEESDKIIQMLQEEEQKAFYDVTNDTYYIEIAEELESFKGRNITVNDITVHVYDIASGVWTWDIFKEDEED